MPLLTLGFFCLRRFHNYVHTLCFGAVLTSIHRIELDRGNIANAITDDFMEDLGISQNQFNVGQQMLSLGIVLFGTCTALLRDASIQHEIKYCTMTACILI